MIMSSPIRLAIVLLVLIYPDETACGLDSAVLPSTVPTPGTEPPAQRVRCGRTFCAPGDTCRKFKARGCLFCRPVPRCVSCVPEGIDDKCKANGFARALLVGNPNQMKTLKTQGCRRSRSLWWWRLDVCPRGTACRGGICCHGNPNNRAPPSDPVCPGPDCPGGCPPDHTCQKCGDGHACLRNVKPGTCPRPAGRQLWCLGWRARTKSCHDDGDCPNNQKCCRAICGQFKCRTPTGAPGGVCDVTSTAAPPSTQSTEPSSLSTEFPDMSTESPSLSTESPVPSTGSTSSSTDPSTSPTASSSPSSSSSTTEAPL